MFDQIEKIKSEYTDKYVAVDASRAELARFKDLVGQVKTVNMSGRALVEFIDYNLSTGWFDIDLDYLKVVDKPAPKPKEEKKPAAKKAAPKKEAAPKDKTQPKAEGGEKKLSPLEMARQQGAAGKEAVAKANKPSSTADILAAARGGAKAEAKAPEQKAEEPAAPKPAASDKPGKVDRSKMSVADMLAMARGGGAPAKEEAPADEPEPAVDEAVEEQLEEAAAEADTEPAAASPSGGKVDKASMSVDEMIAYCREHDA